MTITPRRFALGLGTVAFIIGALFLVLPASIDYHTSSVECGSGISGLSKNPGLADSGAAIANAQLGFADEGSPRESACASKIHDRQMIGWPLVGIGLAIAAGALLIGVTFGQPAPRTE